MDGVHDMGGMHGFGPIPIEPDEPVFHSEWEAKAFAFRMAVAARRKWTLDTSRHANERLLPHDYLSFSYYERWIAGLATLMVENELVSRDELASGQAARHSEKFETVLTAEGARNWLAKGSSTKRDINAPPIFKVGEKVLTNRNCPPGHTRLPRYARGRFGEIVIHHGAYVFPDTVAHFQGENPQHLYAVRFTARELWGDQGNERDSVTLDLWESYFKAL